VAPLDWGLGHATRCIPVIKELLKYDCDVYIAADKELFFLLKKEFPSLVFLRCKGYEIKYGRSKSEFFIKMLFQFPKIFLSVLNENRWLKKVVRKYKIDAVVSDNRFGMYSKKIPSVFITHQLRIMTGNRFTDFIAQKINYYFIKKYTRCWIPDYEDNGLGGELSHPEKIPPNVIYIGILSRFHSLSLEKVYDLMITISGPEPQRSQFEKKILKDLEKFSGSVLMVRGLPGSANLLPTNSSIKIINHLPALELNKSLERSKMIIGRSGYTTIMDMALLKKKAILIPTPGQAEQEYLAEYLFKRNYFFSVEQDKFSIEAALKGASLFEFKAIDVSSEEYKKVIKEFVLSLKSVNFASQ
jgi:uncharacterized protein (TIGR00661 family)